MWESGSLLYEREFVASFDHLAIANFEPKASSDSYAPSKPEVNPDGVPVNVHFSSDCETVTTPGATFLGVPQVYLKVGVGVRVLGERFWILIIIQHADQPLVKSHILGSPPRIDYVQFWGQKYVKNTLLVLL